MKLYRHRQSKLGRSSAGWLGAALLAGSLVEPGAFGPSRPLPPLTAEAAVLQRSPAEEQDTCPEPNDGFAQACPIAPGAKLSGYISTADDLDTFVIRVGSPGQLLATLTNLPADYDLHIYNAAAQLVAESTAEGTADEKLDVQIDILGNYFIFVNSGRGAFNPNSPYLLVVDLLGSAGPQPSPQTESPAPTGPNPPAGPASAAAPASPSPAGGPPAVIESVDNTRAVLRHADGSAVDGAAPGTTLNPGDSIASVGSGEVAIRLIGGSLARVGRDSSLNLIRAELTADGVVNIALDQYRGHSAHTVAATKSPASSYTVFANKLAIVAHGTSFEVTLRDDTYVLFDCVDCDPNRVTAADKPISSGQRLAISPRGELFWLKLHEDPPNPELEQQQEEERKRQEEQEQKSKSGP